MKKRSGSNDKPTVNKTIHIPLPEGRLKLRAVLVAALIVLAVVSLAIGVNSLVSTDAGLQEITVLSGEMNAGEDFTFYYNLGYDGADATDERREVRTIYSEAAGDAMQLFSADVDSEEFHNLRYINSHPNEEITVDAALYSALELLEDSGTRYHYLAPLYEQYYSLFNSALDSEAAEFDPRLNEAQAEFFSAVAAYAADGAHVSLELLGGNTVRLNVSGEYLSFAEDNAVARFVDLAWMENAFVADYIAEELAGAGYTRGALISNDGFMRCLDGETGSEYSFTFSHRDGNTITGMSTLRFAGTVSMVYLHDYPLENDNTANYYVYEDGTIRSAFLDVADGLDRTAIPELAAYSYTLSCAETALLVAPIYIAGSFDLEALEALDGAGVSAYYYEAGVLRLTGEA